MSRSAAGRLVDWGAAAGLGRRFAGVPPPITPADRAQLSEELSEVVREADSAVSALTGLSAGPVPSRAWAMTRGEWIDRNLRAFEQILEPIAERLLSRDDGGAGKMLRRRVLAFQIGGILGYLSRKVLGQYDLFVPADDRDLIYFVGPNVVELERKHSFSPRDFRMWLALHEVTHRLQFEGVPWLRGYLNDQVDEYLGSVELDARQLLERLRRARDELMGGAGWREMGVLTLVMTPEQREIFRRMQALMSLLEGHGNYVMERLSDGRVQGAEQMRRTLQERRNRAGLNRAFQRAVGLDVKVRQYDMGERFVAEAVQAAGDEGFARVWERPENLPTLAEIGRPEAWAERVA